MKTEKRLRKIDEERKQLQMLASDTPTGMSDAFARRQTKTGEAHMVLSVGNKSSVQQAAEGKGKGKGKR
jgi:U4/U6.U5 tri-snRNP-associated protein 1